MLPWQLCDVVKCIGYIMKNILKEDVVMSKPKKH